MEIVARDFIFIRPFSLTTIGLGRIRTGLGVEPARLTHRRPTTGSSGACPLNGSSAKRGGEGSKERMSFSLRGVRVPPNSASLEEARRRTLDFFKLACRSIPAIMETYNLYDVVIPSQLRSTISSEIHKNAHITNPKVCTSLPQSIHPSPPLALDPIPSFYFLDSQVINPKFLCDFGPFFLL